MIEYTGELDPHHIKYLQSRGLSPFKGVQTSSLTYNGKMYFKDLFLFIHTLNGDIAQIEIRQKTGKYNKIYHNDNYIPIYNLNNAINNLTHKIVITESIFDAESINQHIDNTVAIATSSASVRKLQLVFLQYALRGREIYTAFDNDTGGKTASRLFVEYMNATVLSFPHSDINSFLVNAGSENFKQTLIPQIN